MEPESIGPYRVEERLGAGGMGSVVRAWDDRLRRRVAIKSLAADTFQGEARERLRREAQTLAGLDHPGLTEIYDILSMDGHDHLVMEYVEGEVLTSRLVDGPMPVDEAVRVARRIADALQPAHSAGVVHRDIKAENVMLTPEGGVKLLDFGIAKRVDPGDTEESLTEDGVVMGTSRAMSPEQAEGIPVDHRSDFFSLGTLLYEMITGRHPFQGDGALDTMQRVVGHKPQPARRLNLEVPKDLEAYVERLLEKDPLRRPADAGEVSHHLALIQEGLEHPEVAATPTRPWWQSRWAVVGTILMLTGTVIAVVALL